MTGSELDMMGTEEILEYLVNRAHEDETFVFACTDTKDASVGQSVKTVFKGSHKSGIELLALLQEHIVTEYCKE